MLCPVGLRAVPLDLVVVPEADVSGGRKVYLVDVIGVPLPRRLALFADDTSAVRAIAQLAGAQSICDLSTTVCSVRSSAPDNRQQWDYDQVVRTEHGAGLTLWIEPVSQGRVVAASMCVDKSSFMQMLLVDPGPTNPEQYTREAVNSGYMHVWIHDCLMVETFQHNHRRIVWDRPRAMQEVRRFVRTGRREHRTWAVIPVSPVPIMGGIRQPTLILHPDNDHQFWAILVELQDDVKKVFGTFVLEADLMPFSVDFLFDRTHLPHGCGEISHCTALLDEHIFQYRVDIPVYDGAFVILQETAIDETSATTCSGLSEQAEESTLTDDDVIHFTQLDLRQFQFIRCPNSGRPISTQMRRSGMEDMDQHWQFFEQEMLSRTSWHRSQALQQELNMMAPLADRDTKVFLVWFAASDTLSRRDDLRWQESWTAQTGLLGARAEIRLLIWEQVPPDAAYALGTVHPQPTPRQQSGRGDICVVGQTTERWRSCWSRTI